MPSENQTSDDFSRPPADQRGADAGDLVLAALDFLRRSLSGNGETSGSLTLARQKSGLLQWADGLGLLLNPADYTDWLTSLKSRIQGARQRALLSANAEQIRLYHDIVREILERQSREGWGVKVIYHLSSDLRAAFPAMKGLSARNLKYMKFFAEHCPDRQFVQQSAAQLTASTPSALSPPPLGTPSPSSARK